MSFKSATIIVSCILMLICYIIGSVNFAIIFTKKYANTDVRKHGSGNAGMTNVLRTAGKLPALFTLLCDFGKGAVAVLLGRIGAYMVLEAITDSQIDTKLNPLYFAYIGGLFCLLGHIYPLFFSFKGGKGVASLAGIMLFIDWRVFLIAIGTFALMVLFTRIVSISSIVAAITLPISTLLFYSGGKAYSFTLFGFDQRTVITILSLLFTIIIIVKHINNIKRLIKGEEKKLNFKRK